MSGVIIIADLPEPSQVPKIAEPWFLLFDAQVEFHMAMTPQDLQRADLESLGKKWG